ncbi:MAG: hypothetical protein CO035_07350 [Candidatus Omnitrophica bacterium CG_4_9_14_0_2_um_filter_42_8]|nr:MAG: hypothetical protein CO035_07350 [Candidatus Omnitrophica bacterium CG_4_9_14_0_2_um_filter_42_8]
MKTVALAAMVFILMFSSVNIAGADEIDDLRAEMQKLREDYESKIQKLQTQIETLDEKQEERASKIEEKVDKKVLDVEYVGRYEGPFGKGGLLIKNPSGFGNVSVGGYADMEFENFENSNSTFDQARFIINLGAQPHERLLFYSEYEIEHGGPNAADSGQGEAKVEQAWISYLINDMVNLRGGIVLVPFGKFNLLHDSDIQDLTERPIVSRRLLSATWMESGFGAFGEFNIGETLGWKLLPDFYLNYESYIINGLDEDISDTGMRNAKGSISSDANNNKAFVSRLGAGLNRNLELGLSSYLGRYGRSGSATRNGKDNLAGLGADINFKAGAFELVGDFAYLDFEDGALVDHDNDNAADEVSAPKYMRGFYVEPRYHFWPKFLNNTFMGRGFKDPKLTLVSRYDWVSIGDDGDAGDGDNKERRFTLGLNYRPIESWVFKMEYQWNASTNETLERGDKNGVMASMAMGF